MIRQWTLADSSLIAERVMEWQVTEHRGALYLANASARPDWMQNRYGVASCRVPNWPRDPAAAAMALAAIQMDGWRYEGFWAMGAYSVRLIDPISKDCAVRVSRDWSEAVMLAIVAAVRG